MTDAPETRCRETSRQRGWRLRLWLCKRNAHFSAQIAKDSSLDATWHFPQIAISPDDLTKLISISGKPSAQRG